jgi:transcriptional regulator with XRE-family HTH domain
MRTESIGKRLRRLRTERGLSQRDLSQPGVSYAYISRIEAGQRLPSVKAMRKLAERLGVSPLYLERGEQPFSLMIDPVEWRVEVAEPEVAIELARVLLEVARGLAAVPRVSFYGPDGTLVRSEVTRTDLAVHRGRCWCGRGALRGEPGAGFCCAAHEALWGKMDPATRGRVLAGQFIAIYGGARMRQRKYPVSSTKKSGARAVERDLSNDELVEEIRLAEIGENEADPSFREEWLGRLLAEQERRKGRA